MRRGPQPAHRPRRGPRSVNAKVVLELFNDLRCPYPAEDQPRERDGSSVRLQEDDR